MSTLFYLRTLWGKCCINCLHKFISNISKFNYILSASKMHLDARNYSCHNRFLPNMSIPLYVSIINYPNMFHYNHVIRVHVIQSNGNTQSYLIPDFQTPTREKLEVPKILKVCRLWIANFCIKDALKKFLNKRGNSAFQTGIFFPLMVFLCAKFTVHTAELNLKKSYALVLFSFDIWKI